MPTCDQCGGEIEFRVIYGQTRPIHRGGAWSCPGSSGEGERSSSPSSPSKTRMHSSYRVRTTYVNPNARCPVCNADVFFYESPDDGRVFFDELGPPWPKHACTDQGLDHPMIIRALGEYVLEAAKRERRGTQQRKMDPAWRAAGFSPFSDARGQLVGSGIRICGTVLSQKGGTSRSLEIRVSSRHQLRTYATDPQLAPWSEVGSKRWAVLHAIDTGLVMIREDARTRSVLLSIVTVVPLVRAIHGQPSACQTEILEVHGESEIDA